MFWFWNIILSTLDVTTTVSVNVKISQRVVEGQKSSFKPIALKNRKLPMFPSGFVAIYRNRIAHIAMQWQTIDNRYSVVHSIYIIYHSESEKYVLDYIVCVFIQIFLNISARYDICICFVVLPATSYFDSSVLAMTTWPPPEWRQRYISPGGGIHKNGVLFLASRAAQIFVIFVKITCICRK